MLLLDGPLIMSFLHLYRKNVYRSRYIGKLLALLKSAEKKVALIGYLDVSHAKDLTKTAGSLFGLNTSNLTDPELLNDYLGVFDRTCAFLSQDSILQQYRGNVDGKRVDYSNQMCFAYLRVNSQRPVRIEFPRWVVAEGKLNDITRLICASSAIGAGYPYELSKAHENVVLGSEDQANFQRVVEAIASQNEFEFAASLKHIRKENPVQ